MPEPSPQLALVLLVIGLAVFFLELFVPSAGALFVIASTCVIGSVVVAFLVNTSWGIGFSITVMVMAFVLPGIGIQIWKRTPIGRRLFLSSPSPQESPSSSESFDDDDQFGYQALVGQIGKTVTPQRPSGMTEVDGLRVNTVTEGVMIENGSLVRVVRVEGNRVVIRKLSDKEREGMSIDSL